MGVDDYHRADPVLREHLDRRLGPEARKRAEPVLDEVGRTAAQRAASLADDANANPPTLRRYDKHGDRVDAVDLHPSYEAMQDIAYGELGLVAMGYGDDRVPRPLQFAACYLFSQGEQGLYCPVALTDGTALLVDRYGEGRARDLAFERLTARDRSDRWEGAMFLTERAGGSDVGAAETTAQRGEDGTVRLHGRKWFCSNANAEVWSVLARPQGAPGGTEGLGLYLVPRHLEDGSRNAFRLERLKDKLGTRSMATGEIELDGAEAIELGGAGTGFEQMEDMLVLSRVHNSIAAAGLARRCLVEAVAYARDRGAFGKTLDEHALHRRVLLDLALDWEASLVLSLEAGHRMEQAWFGDDEEAADLLRALTPLTKNYTARVAVDAASEACECLGGNGYVEDWVTPRLLRDAQVLPIWEGTTNILSLDTLRAAEEGAVETLLGDLEGRLDAAPAPDAVVDGLRDATDDLTRRLLGLREASQAEARARARDLCFDLARTTCATLLAENADDRRGELVAEAYLEKALGEGNDVRTGIAVDAYDVVVDGAVVETT
jgi:alkylation response protein AidB-like acyl-CoA dehydrogenase